jgi:hypothetical protein
MSKTPRTTLAIRKAAKAERPAAYMTGLCKELELENQALRAEAERHGWPITLEWGAAPVKTQWGAGMRVAEVALSKDATASIYAHEDDLHLVRLALWPSLGPNVAVERQDRTLACPSRLSPLRHDDAGIGNAEIDELIGECVSGGVEAFLVGEDDLRRFARSVLVHGQGLLREKVQQALDV